MAGQISGRRNVRWRNLRSHEYDVRERGIADTRNRDAARAGIPTPADPDQLPAGRRIFGSSGRDYWLPAGVAAAIAWVLHRHVQFPALGGNGISIPHHAGIGDS